jgi:hypothetical protein
MKFNALFIVFRRDLSHTLQLLEMNQYLLRAAFVLLLDDMYQSDRQFRLMW